MLLITGTSATRSTSTAAEFFPTSDTSPRYRSSRADRLGQMWVGKAGVVEARFVDARGSRRSDSPWRGQPGPVASSICVCSEAGTSARNILL